MSKLTTKGRKRIPDSKFGLPEERKYPVEDKPHARNAKARASAAYHEGHLTKAQEERIDRKANRVLHGVRPKKEHELDHWGA